MRIEEKLRQMGLELPPTPTPSGSYIPALCVGDLIFASGQAPCQNGQAVYNGVSYKGKAGKEISVEKAYEAARICALLLLAEIKYAIGDLDRIDRIVKLNGFVNSTDDFKDQPKVINGASDLLIELFGENGRHARSAVGVSTLPCDVCVEIELIAILKPETVANA